MVIIFNEVGVWNRGNRGFSEYGIKFTRMRSRGGGEIRVGNYFGESLLGDGRQASRGHVVND